MKARLALVALALPVLTGCSAAEVLTTVGLKAPTEQGLDVEGLEESVRWELNAANNFTVMGVDCTKMQEDLVVCRVQGPGGDFGYFGVPVVKNQRGVLFKFKSNKIKTVEAEAAIKAAVAKVEKAQAAKAPAAKK